MGAVIQRTRAMRRLVDAARQARDDDEAGFAALARELAGKFQPGAGGVTRADDRDHRPHGGRAIAAHAEQWRRIVEGGEPRGIAVLADRAARPRRARSGSRSSAARAVLK
jgi:hypothetical protein